MTPVLVAAHAAAFSAMIALALAMDRHREQVFGRARTRDHDPAWLRWGGSALLAMSLACHLLQQGTAVGLLGWMGALTVGGVGTVLLLAYWPRKAPAIGIAAAALALASSVVAFAMS